MKLEKFNNIFENHLLRDALQKNESKQKEYGQSELLNRVFNAPNNKELLPLFIEAINTGFKSEKRTCRQLAEKLNKKL